MKTLSSVCLALCCFVGCRSPLLNPPTADSLDAGGPAKSAPDLSLPSKPTPDMGGTDESPPSDCTYQFFLDRDSAYRVAEAIDKCLADPSSMSCVRIESNTENRWTIRNIPEGVGTIRFDYTDNADGTHTLTASQRTGMGREIVLVAKGIPADITLEQAASNFFNSQDTPGPYFTCTITN